MFEVAKTGMYPKVHWLKKREIFVVCSYNAVLNSGEKCTNNSYM